MQKYQIDYQFRVIWIAGMHSDNMDTTWGKQM